MLRITLIAAALLCALLPAEARPRHHIAQAICDNLDITNPSRQAIFGGSGIARMAALESFASRRVGERRHKARTHQRRAVVAQESFGGASRLWCSDFANMITGGGTGSRVARSWLTKPRISPQVGAMVVTSRRGGGHVGIVSGFTANGDPIVISGNHGHRVGEGVYPRSRIIAYVSP